MELAVESPPGQLVGFVKQDSTFCVPTLTVFDETRRKPLLRIVGRCCPGVACHTDVEFPIVDLRHTTKKTETTTAATTTTTAATTTTAMTTMTTTTTTEAEPEDGGQIDENDVGDDVEEEIGCVTKRGMALCVDYPEPENTA